MTELWIVCHRNDGMDPRIAKPIFIAEVDDEGFDAMNRYLMQANKIAFKYGSYEKWFKNRCNLDVLPRKQFMKGRRQQNDT